MTPHDHAPADSEWISLAERALREIVSLLT